MSGSVLKGFWRETGRKVVKAQKLKAQGWFVRHPLTFGLAWGVKGLVYDLPAWGVRSGYRKWTGKPKPEKAASTAEAVTEVEVEVVDSDGNVSSMTRTTRTTGGFAMPPPARIGAATSDDSRPALVVVDPIERTNAMESSRNLLQRRRLGKAFLGLAAEFDAFVPVRGDEALSTLTMIHDAYMGFKRVSMSVEEFADVVADSGLNRRIVVSLYAAAGAADALDRAMGRANRQVAALYDGQLEQEQSPATTVAAVPVPVGLGVDAEGIGPYSSAVALGYETFAPPAESEATEIFEHIRISQAGFAVLSDSLTHLARRLHDHGVDTRVRRLIRVAGGNALAAADHFRAARQTMSQLYRGQMAQEASGVATIRTAPMRRAG